MDKAPGNDLSNSALLRHCKVYWHLSKTVVAFLMLLTVCFIT